MDAPFDSGLLAASGRRRARVAATTSRRRLWIDRLSRWIVTAGGLGIIASVLGLLVFILGETWPVLRPARVTVARPIPLATTSDGPAGAPSLLDERRTLAATLAPDSTIAVLRFDDPQTRTVLDPFEGATARPAWTSALAFPSAPAFILATTDGRIANVGLDWKTTYDAASHPHTEAALRETGFVEVDPEHRPIRVVAAALPAKDSAVVAAQLADGRIAVVRHTVVENELSGEKTPTDSRRLLAASAPLAVLAVDREGRFLFGGSATGDLFFWDLSAGETATSQTTSLGATGVTALALLVGERALAVGQGDGAISIWFPVPQADQSYRLERVRDFPRRSAAITSLAASARNRTFLATDAAGGLGLYYSTSGRVLWDGNSGLAAPRGGAFAPKGDGALLWTGSSIADVAIDNPHPETGLGALFGKLWYEGYAKPEFVWQSTGGSDDFEPKLSLVPLLWGTLKGTFYSLLLAVPLGVFGAMYASQFLHPRFLALVKPTIEIMAALPSVVLGFLAALWLAPVIERYFPALLLAVWVIPLVVWLTGVAWYAMPLAMRNRVLPGGEIVVYAVAIVAAGAGVIWATPAFARFAFGGSFQSWLLSSAGVPYDQRNAIVVGLAMGIAVVPILFAISEDAFSSVPKNLVAGSLALGANRWQTVTRVVLPTASPGIFSAIMIGFGRAIGETMIVLMATGNTPIISWNPLNGFRTLSANIAVEIPEAPFGGTLYRVLFLSGLLLFLLTFVVNTAAELVRQRLRHRYGRL